jgi:hypothetical protein
MKKREPFAVVESVQEGSSRRPFTVFHVWITSLTVYALFTDSPAASADLRAGDLVLSFGTADATNHRNLEAIREIVMRNIGSAIRVVVLRPLSGEDELPKQAVTGAESLSQIHELSLTPQKWRGAGVLGCLLVPYQEIGTNQP